MNETEGPRVYPPEYSPARNLPRLVGKHDAPCPYCGRPNRARVSKCKVDHVTRYEYRYNTCRKCGMLFTGLLPR